MESVFLNCCACSRKGCPLQHCSEKWLAIFDREKTPLFFRPRDHIIREGHEALGIYFIYRGKVKLTTTGINDKEQIIGLAKNEDIIGHSIPFQTKASFNAIAFEDTYVALIDYNTLQEAFMENPTFTFTLMQHYSMELKEKELRLKYLSQMNNQEKIAEALLFLEKTFGLDQNQALNVNITRQDIADLAGTQIDHVSRNLTAFEKENFLQRKNKQIIINDKEGLSELLKRFGKSASSH